MVRVHSKKSPNSQIPTSCLLGMKTCQRKQRNTVYTSPVVQDFFHQQYVEIPYASFTQNSSKYNQVAQPFFGRVERLPSLKLTAKAPENGWLEDYFYLLSVWVSAHFQECFAVSFREWS